MPRIIPNATHKRDICGTVLQQPGGGSADFGVEIDGRAAPDHLLTQLEFLAWPDHCEAAGNADPESLHTSGTGVIRPSGGCDIERSDMSPCYS